MTERIIEGVRIRDTGHKRWQYDYEPGDLKAVYNRREWSSWDEMIHWLEQEGEADNELTPGETIALVEDLRSVRDMGAPFVMNPTEAFELVHKHRNENNRRFAQEHAEHQRR